MKMYEEWCSEIKIVKDEILTNVSYKLTLLTWRNKKNSTKKKNYNLCTIYIYRWMYRINNQEGEQKSTVEEIKSNDFQAIEKY